MTAVSAEYVQARRVLLDALGALGPHRASCVLVGAQAVYVHTGEAEFVGYVTHTTDADLVMDLAALGPDPRIEDALLKAGFTHAPNPGSWEGEGKVKIDLMTAPYQSPGKNRDAKVPGHGEKVARVTPGLEPCLVDRQAVPIRSLDPADEREFTMDVAGPAALLVAKATKVRERHETAQRGGRDRRKPKDCVDCLRLLQSVQSEILVEGFARHARDPHAEPVSRAAIEFLTEQLGRGDEDIFRQGVLEELADPVAGDSYSALLHMLISDMA